MDVGKIAQRIQEIEQTTDAELVAAVVPQSGGYEQARWRFAVVAAMIITFCIFVYLNKPYHQLGLLFCVQLALIYAALLLSRVPTLLRRLISPRERSEQMRESAAACFYSNDLHRTKNQNGILIYVSLMEHQVEILADKGIAKKVAPEFWQTVVNPMLPLIRDGKITEAVEQALLSCAVPLRQHFPKTSADTNELPNRPIVA